MEISNRDDLDDDLDDDDGDDDGHDSVRRRTCEDITTPRRGVARESYSRVVFGGLDWIGLDLFASPSRASLTSQSR